MIIGLVSVQVTLKLELSTGTELGNIEILIFFITTPLTKWILEILMYLKIKELELKWAHCHNISGTSSFSPCLYSCVTFQVQVSYYQDFAIFTILQIRQILSFLMQIIFTIFMYTIFTYFVGSIEQTCKEFYSCLHPGLSIKNLLQNGVKSLLKRYFWQY